MTSGRTGLAALAIAASGVLVPSLAAAAPAGPAASRTTTAQPTLVAGKTAHAKHRAAVRRKKAPAKHPAAGRQEKSRAKHRAAARHYKKRTRLTVRKTGVLAHLPAVPNVTHLAPGRAPASPAALPPETPAGPRAELPAAQPGWVEPATAIGRVRTTQQIQVTVVLGWSHPDELKALIAAVTDPASPQYGDYLTPAAFRARFGPAASDAAAVTKYLTAQGLAVDGASTNGARIAAHGSAADVEAAFGTYLNAYRVRGKTLRAPSRAPSLPAAVAPAVVSVQGLDQGGAFTKPDAAPAPLFRNATPCSSSYGQQLATTLPTAFSLTPPYAVCGYAPAQVRSAYGLTANQDGAGEAVGIVDAYASPTIEEDVQAYSARHGLPALADGQLDLSLTPSWLTQTFQTYNPDTGYGDDPQGWYGEQTLDIEAVHGIAPKATIVYAGARGPFDVSLDDALNDLVDSGLVHIVSNSYGQLESDTTQSSRDAFKAIADQAAATGVGLYASSGDDGDNALLNDARQPDFPASSPGVTAVGGTALGIGAAGNYVFEEYWGTDKSSLVGGAWTPAPGTPSSFVYGGGGGTSAVYAQPDYQQTFTPAIPDSFTQNYPPHAGGQAAHRVVPDVAAIADPQTGMIVGQSQTAADGTVAYDEYRVGGTSLASPVFAAIMAIADQDQVAAGEPRLGFANPALYAMGADAFHDVLGGPLTRAQVRVDYVNGEDASGGTVTSLRAIGDTQSLTAQSGYDDATGRGSPNGSAFFDALPTTP